MKKIYSILTIGILTLIIIMLTYTLICSVKNGFDLEEIEKIPENIKKEEQIQIDKTNVINIYLRASNVTVMLTEEEKVKIVQYSNKELKPKEMFLIDKSTKNLTIREQRQKVLYNICKNQIAEYEIYIPKAYKGSVIIETISGNANIKDEMNLANLQVQTTNGNITFFNPVVANKITITTASGNIQMNDINTKELNIETLTGDVQIQKIANSEKKSTLIESILKAILGDNDLLKLENLVAIKTVSGDINIEDVSGEMILQTSSGNVCLNNCKIKKTSQITAVSGNLKIKMDTNNLDCKINANTTSGTINLSNEIGKALKKTYVELLLQTASGNIQVD